MPRLHQRQCHSADMPRSGKTFLVRCPIFQGSFPAKQSGECAGLLSLLDAMVQLRLRDARESSIEHEWPHWHASKSGRYWEDPHIFAILPSKRFPAAEVVHEVGALRISCVVLRTGELSSWLELPRDGQGP